MTSTGIITGLEAEIRVLRAAARREGIDPTMFFAAGGDAGLAGEAARRMASRGAQGLVSFGLAGGLDPALAPGCLVIPATVADPAGKTFAANAAWRARLLHALAGLGPVAVDAIAGVARPVTTPAEKTALGAATGAQAADMESHAVARAAAAAGLPFAVLRAVADPARRGIPDAALAGFTADGKMPVLPVLAALVRRPGEFPGLIVLARDARKGLAALRRAAAVAGSVLFRL